MLEAKVAGLSVWTSTNGLGGTYTATQESTNDTRVFPNNEKKLNRVARRLSSTRKNFGKSSKLSRVLPKKA